MNFISVLNFLLFLLAAVFCAVLLHFLRKVRPFHQNLSILLGHMAAAFILAGITDGLWSLGYYGVILFPVDVCWLIKTGYLGSCYIIGFTPIAIVIERTAATIGAKTYEFNTGALFGIGSIIVQWIFTLFVSIWYKFTEKNGDQACTDLDVIKGSTLNYSVGTICVSNFIGVPAFIALMLVNKKQYEITFKQQQSHSLSERYQLAENIKTTRFIMPVAAINFICVFIGAGLTIAFYTMHSSKEMLEELLGDILTLVFHTLLPFYGILFALLCVFGHPALRQQLKRSYCVKKVGPAMLKDGAKPRNPNGVSLIIDAREEYQMHFAALDAVWN